MSTFVDKELPEFHQAQGERKNYDIECAPAMPSSVTLSSAAATLIDPDGNEAVLDTAVTVSGTIATATVLGTEIDETGTWYLQVVATLSNAETPTWRGQITVDF